MTDRHCSPFEIYSEALRTLEAEPGTLTPEKADLRARIAEYEPMHRLVSPPAHARNAS